MRIVEILLPKGATDRGLSPQVVRKIDLLQKRMDSYVDKILSPDTSVSGKEFLKSKLRDDYYELKDILPKMHAVAEDSGAPVQYEVYDRRTGLRVPGRGPYANISRAARAVDQLDNKYGAYRYGHRPVRSLNEAVHKLPLSHKDFELVKQLMERPIPAAIASIYIHEVIDDDELNDQLHSLEETDPGRDVRPMIAEWFKRVMPDQLHRFTGDHRTENIAQGVLSPIHGYDPQVYSGQNHPVTGNAYGRK